MKTEAFIHWHEKLSIIDWHMMAGGRVLVDGIDLERYFSVWKKAEVR